MTLIERIHRHDYDCITPRTLTPRCVRRATMRRLEEHGTLSPYLRLALRGELRMSVVGGSLR